MLKEQPEIPTRTRPDGGGYRHEALLYAGTEDFVARTVPFLREGLASGEPILVVVASHKIELLRDALGRDASGGVRFADMAHVGRNPARIIPAWNDFLADNGKGVRPVRGIGEPIWAERTPEELVESQRHEALLNLAFSDASGFHLLCPYNTAALAPEVIEEARRTHHVVAGPDGEHPSPHPPDPSEIARPFDRPLPEPESPAETMTFDAGSLNAVRRFVARFAAAQGLALPRSADLVLAAGEIATNTVRHGGGAGTMRMWRGPHSVICEVTDAGRIEDPMAGRRRPDPTQQNGFGLWLANHLCDLVQMRTFLTGSVVRLHTRT